jgi:hypothetical protein
VISIASTLIAAEGMRESGALGERFEEEVEVVCYML